MCSIFLSSAEASGDHYMAEIAAALRNNGYEGRLWGMGAAESRETGIDVLWPGEQLQLFGFTEVFSSVPRILRLISEVAEKIVKENPSAVVVVDSPDYHLRLIKRIRKYGYKGKVFYVSPPTVWAWRSGRIRQLIEYVDECFPLYSFENDYYVSHGCNSYWDGAPLLEEFTKRGKVEIPAEFKNDDKLVAFMPGSRRSEITKLVPVMREAARNIAERGWHPVFSVAPGLNPDVRRELTAELDSENVEYFDGSGRTLLAAAQCSVSASGTVTVESMLLEKYMVSVYKFNALSGFLAKRMIKLPWFSMANLLVGEEIYPELFQEKCNASAITEALLSYLEADEAKKNDIKQRLSAAKLKLGSIGVYDRWAKRITEITGC